VVEVAVEWTEREGALHADIKTRDFASALALAIDIGRLAEAANHHPDLALGWGYLRITLTSHDVGGVTERDRRLAVAIDGLAIVGTEPAG
jgi:4a-hydroxytetrahydrobiopterin dehydratase